MTGPDRNWMATQCARNSFETGNRFGPGRTKLTVVRPQRDSGSRECLAPIAGGEACILNLQFDDFRSRDFWSGGQPVAAASFPIASASTIHVEFAPGAWSAQASGAKPFGDSAVALIEAFENCAATEIDVPGIAARDPVVRQLEACLLQGLQHPRSANGRFLDHVIQALHAHCAEFYVGVRNGPPPSRGGLAPWQERRAKDFIERHLHEDICLGQVASECKLSPSHFARAFRRSTGLPPHRWLLERRVDKAKQLMLDSMLPLAEIALACGFADQSHLNRVFTQRIGTTPRAWRRAQET